MIESRGLERVPQQFLRPFTAIVTHSTTQARSIRRCNLLDHTLKKLILCLGQLVEIVDEIDKKKFLRQTLRKWDAPSLPIATSSPSITASAFTSSSAFATST
jgi:hypothetical protein